MKKVFDFSNLLKLIKCCLIGIIVTLVGVVLFAVVLKFADVPINVIRYVNDAIKVLSIFVMLILVRRAVNGKYLFNAILAGLIYAILTILIFSILNGGFEFNASILYDILFAVITSVIATVIMNVLSRKTT